MKRSSKKGQDSESPLEGVYRQKHLKILLSRLNSMLVALPGCMCVMEGGVWYSVLCMRIMRPSLGARSWWLSGRLCTVQ